MLILFHSSAPPSGSTAITLNSSSSSISSPNARDTFTTSTDSMTSQQDDDLDNLDENGQPPSPSLKLQQHHQQGSIVNMNEANNNPLVKLLSMLFPKCLQI